MTSSEKLPNRIEQQWHDTPESLTLLQKLDELAWDTFVVQNYEQLRNDIWISLRSRGITWYTESNVDDIEQNVWEVFFKSIHKLKWLGEGMLYHRLRKTAVYVVLNYIKNEYRHTKHLHPEYEFDAEILSRWLATLRSLDEISGSIVDEAERNATIAEINHATYQLDDTDSRGIFIKYFRDLKTVQEIADEEDITPDHVRMIIDRATKAVRRLWQLGKLYNPPDASAGDQGQEAL